MTVSNETEPEVAAQQQVHTVLRSWLTDTLTPTVDDPPVPQQALWPFEFVAFQEAFRLAVDAVFEMDTYAGIDPEQTHQMLTVYAPRNGAWLSDIFDKVLAVAQGHGDQVVFRPDAAAVDYACGFAVIAAVSVAVTARTVDQPVGDVLQRVLHRWETAPVADMVPGPAAVLATARTVDDVDPAGSGVTYGESSYAASMGQMFTDTEEAVGFATSLDVLADALPLVFAGFDRGVPVLGVDAATRPELVAAADVAAENRTGCRYRFDAICEPGLPAVAATFQFTDVDMSATVLIPHNDPMWVEFNRFAAQRGCWLVVFRADGGGTRPEHPGDEPGGVVVMFEPDDLQVCLDRIDLSVR